MKPEIVKGNLLAQPVEVIVNAWNRNFLPWWILLPQGIAGAIKKQGGVQLFNELRKFGLLSPGEAVLTSAGKLPFRGIIHVAGLNLIWRATENSIRLSVRNAMKVVAENGFTSVAFPIIGAGTGGFKRDTALNIIVEELNRITAETRVIIVIFEKKK